MIIKALCVFIGLILVFYGSMFLVRSLGVLINMIKKIAEKEITNMKISVEIKVLIVLVLICALLFFWGFKLLNTGIFKVI